MSKKTTDIDEFQEDFGMANDAETEAADNSYDAAYWEERVEWLVPLDMSNPSDTTYFVQVNGNFFKMKRGSTTSSRHSSCHRYRQMQSLQSRPKT